jgi:transcriptional regulator with XRE-family HTH domain
MFGRSERKTPFQREQNQKLEHLRDDCIALFINSGLTQKQIHERGGPTPATISKWLYGETHFPRYASIEAFLLALGHELVPVSSAVAQELRNKGRGIYLNIDVSFVGRPKMPKKGPKHATKSRGSGNARETRHSVRGSRRAVARR